MKTINRWLLGFFVGTLIVTAATIVTKISEYPNVAVPDDNDLFLLASGSTNKNVKWSDVRTGARGGSGQAANQVMATPDGTTGTASIRSLVAADVPGLPTSKITSGSFARSILAAGTANHVLINDGSGNASSEATLGAARFPALTGDVTTPGGSLATTIGANVVSYAKLQQISATQKVLGRNTAGAGNAEEVGVSALLDWLGSTRGSLLFRGASGWTIVAPGTSGYVLTANGTGADPTYQAASGGGGSGVSTTVTALGLSGTNVTGFDCTTNNMTYTLVLSVNAFFGTGTFSGLPNTTTNMFFTLGLQQDGTGGRVPLFTNSVVKWADGNQPVIKTNAGAVSYLYFHSHLFTNGLLVGTANINVQ